MLNKKELASLVGINSHTATLWEKGETEPTAENVEACSRILNFPKEFFYGPDIDEPDLEATSFRSQTSMTASMRDAACAAGAIGFLISDWVEKQFNIPEIKIPDLHLYDDPESAARTLRQEWGLGEKPISNMIQLLESKGVRVFSLAENTAKVNAYALWKDGKPYVFLNTFKSAESSRFDAAHELAHLVLHQDGSVTGREAEDQANRFASAFLMPKADILSELPRVYSLDQLITAKQRWRVSLAALNYRIHKLGITTDWKYRDFCIEIAKRKYNKSEPRGIEREKSIVWQKVLTALWSDKMTHKAIADDLCVRESEISDLLFGVLNPVIFDKTISNPMLSLVEKNNEESSQAQA